jgi:hypothetical protein
MLGQYNRHYWSAKKSGNTEKADGLLKKLKAAGKEPWKVKKT